MPKRGRKFITEFLVPNLNEEKFGVRLAWVDRKYSIFQMQWNHKAAPFWTEDDCQVFVEWDKKRGHYRPMEKEYFTKSKQRFRAVLNKSIQDHEITQFQSEDKNIKIYCIGPGDDVPEDLKLVIVKDTMNDKNDIQSNFLNAESDSKTSTYSAEQDQFAITNFYCNALKDHNYQNIEEQKIPEISYDTSNNDLSLYTLYSNEKISVSASVNILDLSSDEIILKNLYLPILGPEMECNFLPENENTYVSENWEQVLCPVETCVSANSIQDNSLGISVKREIEHSDLSPTKKSKIVLYLKEDKL